MRPARKEFSRTSLLLRRVSQTQNRSKIQNCVFEGIREFPRQPEHEKQDHKVTWILLFPSRYVTITVGDTGEAGRETGWRTTDKKQRCRRSLALCSRGTKTRCGVTKMWKRREGQRWERNTVRHFSSGQLYQDRGYPIILESLCEGKENFGQSHSVENTNVKVNAYLRGTTEFYLDSRLNLTPLGNNCTALR